jgi:hypothetical protein
MAEEAAPRFDEEERMLMERRRNRGSAITNQPVGERLAGRRSAPAPQRAAPSPTELPDLPPQPYEETTSEMRANLNRRASESNRPRAASRSAAEDLNEIVLRLTRGEKPVTETEKRIADRMGIAYQKGGMVKAKKMKSGGKVAPKKMMKGGMTSKPKKMMGGGRAMYAKGGMAKGCK